MSKFMLLIRNEGDPMATVNEQDREMIMQKWGAYMGGLGDKLVDGLPFGSEGKVVSNAGVSNGRHEEATVNVGGYLILEASNLDEAVQLAQGCPAVENPSSNIEVRECVNM